MKHNLTYKSLLQKCVKYQGAGNWYWPINNIIQKLFEVIQNMKSNLYNIVNYIKAHSLNFLLNNTVI